MKLQPSKEKAPRAQLVICFPKPRVDVDRWTHVVLE